MRHVINERPQEISRRIQSLDAPADYQPYRAFISAIPAPTWKGCSPPQRVQHSGVNSHLLLRLSDHLAAPLA